MAGGGAIRCAVKDYRQRQGLTQDELASLVGLRRQAIYDLESGRYLPNTLVALRLARALGCTVETLFAEKNPAELGRVHLLKGSEAATPRLFLAQVREKLVGVPLEGAASLKMDAPDGFLAADRTVDCLIPRAQLAETVLMLGCDPALSLLGGLMAHAAPQTRARAVFASSRRALLAVSEGHGHVAGLHYHGSGPGEGNLSAVRSLSPGLDCLVVAFCGQEEGLMVAPGNPLGLRKVEDLGRGRARLVNREEGAALRKWLDLELSRRGLSPADIKGYPEEVPSHFAGAVRVAGGAADAALGLRIVAESVGLDFVPLAVTRGDLVIPADLRGHPGIRVLLDVLQSSSLRKELSALPGYDASETGKVIDG